MSTGSRTPVIVLDRQGYSLYQDHHGRGFLPASCYAVRLVTDVSKVDEAKGPELESVIGVRGDDIDAYSEAARFLCNFGTQQAARLVTAAERLLLPAAVLREELGIAGPSVGETILFRDKVLMKQHLRASGIRVPDFAPFSEEAARALLAVHPAVIAKPRLGAGTEEVSILRGVADLAAFMTSHQGRLADFEIEEYISGSMFHVDSVVKDGKVTAATAGRYLDDTTSYRALQRCWSAAVPEGALLSEILDFNQRVIACYQGFTGVTHHELFVTGTECCHCEIAARAGGGGIAAGFWSRTGVNLHEAGVRSQGLGSFPLAIEVAPHLTGWVILHAGPGVLREAISIPDEPWVIEARVLANPGELLPAPSSCGEGIAVVTVRGSTEGEVISRLEAVAVTAMPQVSAG